MMAIETVDLDALSDVALKVLNSNKEDAEFGEAKDFRKYDRSKELMEQLLDGVLSKKACTTVKNHIKKIEESIGTTLGEKGTNNHVYFTLEEIHLIYDALLGMNTKYHANIPQKFTMSEAYVWLLTNLKGGTGKTTASVYLAIALALYSFQRPRILVVDTDPQGQVHEYFDGRVINQDTTPTLGQVVSGFAVAPKGMDHLEWLKASVVRKSHVANIDYIPALPSDTRLERFLNKKYFSPETEYDCLKLLNEKVIAPLKNSYDIILIDSPPHNNLSVQSGIYCADGIIIPAATKPMDSEPTLAYVKELAHKVNILKEELDYPGVKAIRALPGMFNERRVSAKTVKRRYSKVFQEMLLPEIIEREGYLNASQQFRTMFDYSTNDDAGTPQRSHIINDWNSVAEQLLRYMERYDDLKVGEE